MSKQVWIIILLGLFGLAGCGKEQTASTDQAALPDSTLERGFIFTIEVG